MTRWEAIHKYRRMVKDNSVPALVCPDDQGVYIPRLGFNDSPVLYCYMCRTTMKPGLALWKQLEAALGEKIEETN